MPWSFHERVVVPIDFSSESLQAVEFGLELVKKPGQLSVVHVLPDLSATEPAELWEAVDQAAIRDRTLEKIRDLLTDPKYREVQIEVLFGDPGYAIVDFARQENADLVVIPSHGRTGWKRLVLGSVAERVVRLAECPVLVLKLTPGSDSAAEG